MISKIVGNIFYVILVAILMICFIGAIIASGIGLAASGESLIIALIVTFVIGFAVMLALGIMSLKELIEACRETDEILKEEQNAENNN